MDTVSAGASLATVGFDDSPTWAAEIAGFWNGWAIPRVTAEVREQIAAWIEEQDQDGDADTAREIRALPLDADGLATINLGLCFWYGYDE